LLAGCDEILMLQLVGFHQSAPTSDFPIAKTWLRLMGSSALRIEAGRDSLAGRINSLEA